MKARDVTDSYNYANQEREFVVWLMAILDRGGDVQFDNSGNMLYYTSTGFSYSLEKGQRRIINDNQFYCDVYVRSYLSSIS